MGLIFTGRRNETGPLLIVKQRLCPKSYYDIYNERDVGNGSWKNGK